MERNRHILLYDGDCPMCIFQTRVISWLDWLNQVELVPLADPRAAEIAPEVTRADLLEKIHCVTPGGRIHKGARAFRFLGFRIPLMIPVALVLWVPGVIWVAERFYEYIAARRQFFSKFFGCQGACEILPEKPAGKESGS